MTGLVDAIGGELFRAALQVWTVAAADPDLRSAVVPLERHFARGVHPAPYGCSG